MTTAIRHSTIENTTGAPVIAGGATVNQGQDYALESIDRKIVGADAGTGAGQTRHAAGMIFAEFYGAAIKRVISASIIRTTGGFDYVFTGTDAVEASIGFSITTADGKSTLRIKDTATGGAGQLVADDHIVVQVELGNS